MMSNTAVAIVTIGLFAVWGVYTVVKTARERESLSAGKRPEVRRAGAVLIEHPHYIDDTDYECSRCGERFDEKARVCHCCGAVFADTEVDQREYDDEEDEEFDMDEEEGW